MIIWFYDSAILWIALESWNMTSFSPVFPIYLDGLDKSKIFLSHLSCLWLTVFGTISLMQSIYFMWADDGKHGIYNICSLIAHRHPNMHQKVQLLKARSCNTRAFSVSIFLFLIGLALFFPRKPAMSLSFFQSGIHEDAWKSPVFKKEYFFFQSDSLFHATHSKYGRDNKWIPVVSRPLNHIFLSPWHHVVFPSKHSINAGQIPVLKPVHQRDFAPFDSKNAVVWNIQVQAQPHGQG